ncbi:hypothetical protein [Rhizobium skierniewicense]|nr:hypothetical protein [Rhizobium skierniewicense]NTF33957.1 hypothetical protein [Rhizobium skierniewicense]
MSINENVSHILMITLNVRAKKETVKPEELVGRPVDAISSQGQTTNIEPG